jgi:putative inorganic carbon (hco3(-)) transporter
MAFFLFILVNAALFIRPAEIVPAMQGWEVYFYLIVACLLLSAFEIIRHVTEKPLLTQPITLAVFGLLAAIFISDALAGDLAEALRKSYSFAKLVLYYLLFVSVVTTSARMRTLLLCTLMFSACITALAVLRYHNVIQLDTITSLRDHVAGTYGDTVQIQRLQGTGAFQDPNELCVLLAALIPVCLYFVMTDRTGVFQALAAAVAPLFGYAIFLTHSRGGFLAFVGGLGAVFWTKYGWKRSAVIGLCGVPLLLLLFAGRQTEISTSSGTARTRIELWQDWLQTFRQNMLVGNTMSLAKEDAKTKLLPGEGSRQLAHNSYLQCFADLGIVGGCLFLGAFLTAAWSVYRLKESNCVQSNLELRQMQPYVFGVIVAYCIGMISLSIPYTVPTFFMLALAVAYARMAQRTCLIAPPPLRVDFRLLGACAAAGAGFLISMYFFVRVFA